MTGGRSEASAGSDPRHRLGETFGADISARGRGGGDATQERLDLRDAGLGLRVGLAVAALVRWFYVLVHLPQHFLEARRAVAHANQDLDSCLVGFELLL